MYAVLGDPQAQAAIREETPDKHHCRMLAMSRGGNACRGCHLNPYKRIPPIPVDDAALIPLHQHDIHAAVEDLQFQAANIAFQPEHFTVDEFRRLGAARRIAEECEREIRQREDELRPKSKPKVING